MLYLNDQFIIPFIIYLVVDCCTLCVKYIVVHCVLSILCFVVFYLNVSGIMGVVLVIEPHPLSMEDYDGSGDSEDDTLGSFRIVKKNNDNPISLQFQCLICIVNHLHEIPSTVLSLLPRSIRIQLLLLLPAVDVCRLEGTPVTNDISMNDEIWEILCKDRIVTSEDLVEIYGPDLHEFSSREEKEERFNVSLTWKEAYFQGALMFLLMQGNEVKSVLNCVCKTDHMAFNVLYSTFYMWPDEDDKMKCTNDIYLQKLARSINKSYNIVRKDDICFRYTPPRYAKLLEGKSTDPLISLTDFAQLILNVCFVSIKIFDQADCFSDDYWLPEPMPELTCTEVIQLFSSVESVGICGDADGIEAHEPCRQIFEIIFDPSRKKFIKSLVFGRYDDDEDYVLPYITGTNLTSLRLEECDCHSSYYFDILNAQVDSLENLSILNCSLVNHAVPPILTKCFDIPSIKTLTITSCVTSLNCQMCIVNNFMFSPHPIHLKFENVRSSYSAVKLDEITEFTKEINNHGTSKTVTIINCSLSVDIMQIILSA